VAAENSRGEDDGVLFVRPTAKNLGHDLSELFQSERTVRIRNIQGDHTAGVQCLLDFLFAEHVSFLRKYCNAIIPAVEHDANLALIRRPSHAAQPTAGE
jgi:hypothetical protein